MPNREIIPARQLFGTTSAWMYNILKHMPPGVMLDIGAAKGEMTRKLLWNATKVRAYEPWPGNWPLWERQGFDHRAELIRAAVSDHPGEMAFQVNHVVTNEPGWQDSAGYSSVGFLAEKGNHRVSCVTLDEAEARTEHVRCIKIDVQGAEKAVLNGARELLKRTDIVILEVDGGDYEAMELMFDLGWKCFDGGYGIINNKDPVPTDQWEITYETTQSTGHKFIGCWPINAPREPRAWFDWLYGWRAITGAAFTDLVFVRPGFLPTFLQAGARMLGEVVAERNLAPDAANALQKDCV